MKKFMFLLAILAVVLTTAFGQRAFGQTTDNDTVWTKNIWPASVRTVMFSPDGSKIFVSTDMDIVNIYDTMTGDSIGTVKGVGDLRQYSPDKNFIYTSDLKKMDAQAFSILAVFDSIPKEWAISSTGLTGDGKYLICINNNTALISLPYDTNYSNIAVYDAEKMKFNKKLKYLEEADDIATSPDGKYFVIQSYSYEDWHLQRGIHFTLSLWDAQTLEKIKVFYQDTIPVNEIKFTPDSKYFAAIINGRIWFYLTNKFNLANTLFVLAEVLTFTEDSKYIITASAAPNSVTLYNIENGKKIYQFKGWGALDIDINQEQNYIIAGVGPGLTLYKTQSLNISENFEKDKGIEIYPNPNDGIAHVLYQNKFPGNYTVDLFDERGIKIANIFNGFLSTEKYEFLWDTKKEPVGTYFCKITGKGLNLTYKIIVSK